MMPCEHLHDTHHFDVRRGRRSIRYATALAVAREADIIDGAAHRVSRRCAAQREAELRAEARRLEREGIPCLSLAAGSEAEAAGHSAFAHVRECMLAMAAELRHEADAIHAAWNVTVVICGNALVTTYRNAA